MRSSVLATYCRLPTYTVRSQGNFTRALLVRVRAKYSRSASAFLYLEISRCAAQVQRMLLLHYL